MAKMSSVELTVTVIGKVSGWHRPLRLLAMYAPMTAGLGLGMLASPWWFAVTTAYLAGGVLGDVFARLDSAEEIARLAGGVVHVDLPVHDEAVDV